MYLKYKFGQIGPNTGQLEDTSQLEDSKYKHDVIRELLHSNSSLGKCLSHIQILWDRHENVLFS